MPVVAVYLGPSQTALAAGRCSTTAGSVEQRVTAFWQCVNSLISSDYLLAEDLGQWARNVIERTPNAGIRTQSFRDSTATMQLALDRGSAGVPSAPSKSTDIEARIAGFWQRVERLG